MPEYNGSFPGILKLMMDNSDIRKVWWYKKAMLVGVADGRAGNLRGLDHMTNILHYLRMHILYNKIPISRINEEIGENGEVLKPTTLQAIETQIDEFLKF
jgi:NAD(P)H-dependent FMN reductase